eukprot:CAMPEP_0206490326 /NCGR_PEP_ID=MMETSP0324_2-20121206/43966_1 /ASSEMBLY_ACC=CAM_ASM_000836 /TAXON_ID=2866 /ORGANISM="Crypthecodinium cohnii, Strain Seligo" /LENGTH=357 /DNA_ID=CAMNT_0053970569 /DNA_START=179 /DNA_END=1252 /DNA_ORIENTATION=-
MALQLGSSIRRLFEAKVLAYSTIPDGLSRWDEMAIAMAPVIEQHAPVTWQELEGAAAAFVPGVNRSVLLHLAVEYELYVETSREKHGLMAAVNEKCTGFGSPGLSGQNNDEDPSLYLDAAEDVVLAVRGCEGLSDSALIYTHPGWPAYMGMNGAGLAVLWQFIDNGEQRIGVPTNVLIREMLTRPTLESALEYLQGVPRAIANNFILTDVHRTVNVEVSPSHFTALTVNKGFVVHTNHIIFDQEMQDHDVGIIQSKTSVERYHALRNLVAAHGLAGMNRGILAGMLRTHPIFRDGAEGTDNHTLASMVFDVVNLTMEIWFKGDGVGGASGHFFELNGGPLNACAEKGKSIAANLLTM